MDRQCLLVLLGAGAGLAAGCGTIQGQAYIRECVARPSTGEAIYVETWHRRSPGNDELTRAHGPVVTWERPGKPPKKLATLVLAEGSAADEPDPDLRADIRAAERRLSKDGQRVCLIHHGRVLASFDYDAGAAVLAPFGHPAWALATTRPAPRR